MMRCGYLCQDFPCRGSAGCRVGRVAPQLRPLVDALTQADRPRSILGWLQKSPGARLLAQLAAEGTPITHDLLDQQPARAKRRRGQPPQLRGGPRCRPEA